MDSGCETGMMISQASLWVLGGHVDSLLRVLLTSGVKVKEQQKQEAGQGE